MKMLVKVKIIGVSNEKKCKINNYLKINNCL